jgi:hypothetical protein
MDLFEMNFFRARVKLLVFAQVIHAHLIPGPPLVRDLNQP